MFFNYLHEKIKTILGPATPPTLVEIFNIEINEWLSSPEHKIMCDGVDYFKGKHKILEKQQIYFDGDKRRPVDILPNAKLIDNQYKKMVIQKINYLCGKPIAVKAENDRHDELLQDVFGARFMKVFNKSARDSLNCGIGWIYVFINDSGELDFMRFDSRQILPIWADDEHTELEYALRIYDVAVYEGTTKKTQRNVEVYSKDGIDFYILTTSGLVPDVQREHRPYVTVGEKGYNWDKIPLVPFKYNSDETPLIMNVRSLQDGLNDVISNFQNGMLKNPLNSILVLKNYDGEDINEFREKLIQHGLVKVSTQEGIDGGIEALKIDIDANSYTVTVNTLKKMIIENAMGYDAKDDRIGANANQMNIQSMYNDIDLDANSMEIEYQWALHELLGFADAYFSLSGKGDFADDEVKFIFNRDMMMNESEVMGMLTSAGVELSQETLISQVPFVDDTKREMERVANERSLPDAEMFE